MQGGYFNPNKQQPISEKSLIKELSFDEAKTMLDSFNKSVMNENLTLEQYFKIYPKYEKYLKSYVTTTDQQSQSTQGLIKAAQEARAAQLAHNEELKNATFSAKASKAALSALATVGNMAAMWLVSKGIELAVTAFGNYIHQAERAREATKESIRQLNSISAEVESLEGKIADLNEEILRLNPITDADDIKNLKMETTEMSAQLAIMKEQKRLEGKEADSNAQKSLGKLQGSRYAVVESYETVVSDAGLPFVFPTLKPKDVTQYQELEIAFK